MCVQCELLLGWQPIGFKPGSEMRNSHGKFEVTRHAGGRKYWGVLYPDGTYTHTARTQGEAKEQAEAWSPDPTLIALDVSLSGNADTPAARAVSGVIDTSRGCFVPKKRGWNANGDAGNAAKEALAALRALVDLRAAVEEAIRDQVSTARTNTATGWCSNVATWDEIGEAMRVTKQSAQARFGKTG